MRHEVAHRWPNDPASAPALAILGLVAALVCLVTERVLPRWSPRPGSADAAALWRVQLALAALAVTAWRQVERLGPDAPPTTELEDRAAEMHDAMRALVPCAARMRRRPPVPGTVRPALVSPRAPALRAKQPATQGLPRDGPED